MPLELAQEPRAQHPPAHSYVVLSSPRILPKARKPESGDPRTLAASPAAGRTVCTALSPSLGTGLGRWFQMPLVIARQTESALGILVSSFWF